MLGDVALALAGIREIQAPTKGCRTSLQAKQDLLHVFLENERIRLRVWLSPLEPERKQRKNALEVSRCSPNPFPSPVLCDVS